MTDGYDALSGDELETWAAFATVLEWVPAVLDNQLRRSVNLTHFEYGLLYALRDAPEHTLRLSVLSSYAHSSLTRMTRATQRLEARGLLRRLPDPQDGRYTLAVLSESGAEIVRRATPGHEDLVRRLVFDNLTATQAKQLRTVSRRIVGAIHESGAYSVRGNDSVSHPDMP